MAGTPPGFLASSIYESESAVIQGQALGDGTFQITQQCAPGDVVLSGGAANVNGSSDLVVSSPTNDDPSSWTGRIQPNGTTDEFSVRVICANQ